MSCNHDRLWDEVQTLRARLEQRTAALNRTAKAREAAEAQVARVEAEATRLESLDEMAHLDHRNAGLITCGNAAKIIRHALKEDQ